MTLLVRHRVCKPAVPLEQLDTNLSREALRVTKSELQLHFDERRQSLQASNFHAPS
jgi:hypothetical protein